MKKWRFQCRYFGVDSRSSSLAEQKSSQQEQQELVIREELGRFQDVFNGSRGGVVSLSKLWFFWLVCMAC
jgi:hypothetical protein